MMNVLYVVRSLFIFDHPVLKAQLKLVTVPTALYIKGRKNFENIWRLAHVSVLDIEVKNGFKTFFQRDLLEKTHILWFFSARFLPFWHTI